VRLLVSALVALSAACTVPVGPAELVRAPLPEVREADWPMFRDDLERSGFAEGSTVGSTVSVLWYHAGLNVTSYGAVKGSPSVVGDTLYCGTDTGRFLAVRIADGEIVWQVQLTHTTHGIHGSPAVVGDMVYIGAYDGTVYAFERDSGLLVWRYKLGYQVGSSPAVVPRWGILFSAHEESPDGGGYVVALDARSGAEIWRARTEAHPHSSVAVDVGRSRVFVGDNHGYLYAFHARTGQLEWRRPLLEEGKADIKTTPTLLTERGLVVFGAWSGKVYALDEDTGETVWEHPTGGSMMASTAFLPSAGIVYAASPTGKLFAIDARNGQTVWAVDVGAHLYSSPAVSGDGRAVVFGAGDGNIVAVDAMTGAEMWRQHLGSLVSGSPTLVGNRIYVTTHKGGLWALETHDPT
jgi:outer membrane protein assembly factor BamB